MYCHIVTGHCVIVLTAKIECHYHCISLGASSKPGRHRRGDPEEDGGDPVHLQVQGGGQVGR